MQIYILNRARETLATTASIYNDKHTLTLEAGSSSYEFTIDKSDEASHYMDSGNYIVLQDDKGKTWLFTILDYEETHNTKTVYAEDAGIELINKAVDIWKGDGPHPFSYYFDLVTKGTPWKLGVNQLAGLERTLTYEGRDTGLGRLLSILKGFDNAECTFDVTVKMNAPAEFKINVYKQVGNDRSDVQIVYNNELNDITKKESRAEFVTALAGVGDQIQTEGGSEGGNIDFSELEYNKDGFVTKKGDKFLRAVDANRTFNPGQESYIESFYEYDTQSPSELLNRTLSKLKTYSEPQYTYTADVKVIDASLVLGDTVTILDHDYNPALYLSARVAKLVKSYTDQAQNEIEFTNYRLLSGALADKLARLQVIVNTLPGASRVSAIETNLTELTKQQEEIIVKVESANGKSTNYYGGSQPENAKQGDSWFYTDEEGNQGIKQYQDDVWVDVISSKFGPKLEEDIKKAQADVDEILRKANNDTTIFRTEGQEAAPTAKKKGDLWFKTDNGQTVMHEWDGQKWHEVVNTKTTDDIANQVDQARVKMEELVKKANDDTTIFRTEGQEAAPTAKKKGDLWFKADNGQTLMNEWDGQKWHEIVSTKTTEDITREIDKAKADAKVLSSEVESAKKQAQEAFAKAGFNADEISNVKTATSEVTETLTSTVRQASELSESLKNVASETASQYSTVSSELSGARNSLNAKASELAKEVASNSANITKANSQLYSQSEGLAKVSQSATKMEQTMTDLSGRVHTVETTASETKEALADAKGNITTLTKRADGTDTKIADAQGRVQTLESRADTWDLELSKKVDNTTYNAGIQNLGNQINLKANKSDLDGYATKAQLSVESDRITQQASAISSVTTIANNANNKIDGLRIGGRNLLKGTSDQFKTISNSGWMWAHNYSNYPYVDLSNFHTGDYLTYSVWVHNTSDVPVRAEIYCFDNNKAHSVTGISNNIISAGNYGWLTVTMQIGANDYYARPSVITTAGQTGSHTIEMREEMLTLGNVRLPWQPSDLDLPDTIVTTVTEVSNAQQIINSSGIHTDINKVRTETTGKINAVDGRVSDVNNKVDNTNSRIDNLSFGGTNLINNSGNPKTTDGWWLNGTSNDRKLIVRSHLFWKNGQENLFALFNRDSNEVTMSSDWVKVEHNTEYTLSYWSFEDSNVVSSDTYFFGRKNGQTSGLTVINKLVDSRVYSTTKAEYVTITFNTGDCDEGYIRFNNNGSKQVGKDAVLFLANIQLEKGNKASDWSLSQNDLQRLAHDDAASQINTFDTKNITPIKQTVTQYTNKTDELAGSVTHFMGAIGYDGKTFTDKFKTVVETAGGTKETYKMLEGKIDGIVVGGKNLLDGTATMGNNGVFTITSSSTSNWSEGYVFAVKEPTSDGEQYILSFDAMASTNGYRMQNHWYYGGISGSNNPAKKITDQDGNVVSVGGDGATFTTLTTSWQRYWYLIDTGNSVGETRIIIGRLNDRYKTGTGWVKIRKAQLEKGNKPSDWGMSDNDINKKISDANVSIAKTNETIKTVDGNVTTVKNNLDKTKSVVTQLANLFDVTVGDSSISVTNNGVLVKGKQIHIDGQTVIDNASIDGAKIKSLDAGKITTGTLNAAKLNVINLNANSINAGTLSGAHLHITKDSYIDNAVISDAKIKSLSASKLTAGQIDASQIKVINLDANNITTGTLTGPGMALDLNNGSFKINNSDNSLKVEMDSGKLRFYRLNGMLMGTVSSSDWTGLSDDNQALELSGKAGAVLKTENFKMTNFMMRNGAFFSTSDAPSSNGSAVILSDNNVRIIGQTDSKSGFSNSRIDIIAGKPTTYKDILNMSNVSYTGMEILGDEQGLGIVNINSRGLMNISSNDNKLNLSLTSGSITADVRNSKNYNDATQRGKFKILDSQAMFIFKKDNKILTPMTVSNDNTVYISNLTIPGDLLVFGNKNNIVQTTAGWAKINAYETAEYYFGDLGTAITDDTSTVRIGIEPLFNETVNTDIPYQVFVTSYGKGYAWVAERGSNYFVIKSSVPGLEIGYEIKAKRKGYENVRLEIDKHMEVNKQ